MNLFINLAAKSLISTLMTSLFIVSMPSIAEETEIERRIEIKAEQGKDVKIRVEQGDHQDMIMLSLEELVDSGALDEKLKALDSDTVEKIKKALARVRFSADSLIELEEDQLILKAKRLEFHNQLEELGQLKDVLAGEHMESLLEKVHELRESEFILEHETDGDQRIIVIDGIDSHVIDSNDGLHKMKRFRLGRDNIVLKGHVDAILKMIEHGQFSSDELDKLQQALDNKR